ncbi:TetR/AcrR family transcriptional regulator [Saccharopolyspora sp. K220]|uniref:TetR/AcrR family transcriptional regulator n=1 Tax=Saccharopolyspora soli TaxID=2926618 RepID=UPI001F5A5C70|nr:TetR/AcrR family transcriptional regulator [Saccharopolyspora soli]MCI2420077.1 TetR/AcrR family transcriptional regulator [Saccharopolyspora soli]
MRADARRNRSAITSAALRLAGERGEAVSMEDIAREAGVGVGTLYRHFPDRRALLEDIAVDALRELLEATRAEVGQTPAWEALLRIVDHCVALPLPLTKSLLTGEPEHPELPELEAEVNALIAEIAAHAQREGDLRADVPPTEVVRVLNVAVCRCGARADDHLTRVLLDGLRAPKN